MAEFDNEVLELLSGRYVVGSLFSLCVYYQYIGAGFAMYMRIVLAYLKAFVRRLLGKCLSISKLKSL